MIDFRYHIVSLISVFLALAVGIILGAGPLKESIGDTLTGQVDVLRSEKDALRTELDETQATLAGTDAFVEGAAPALLDGVLPGWRVGVVQLGPVDDAVQSAVEQQVQAAGASVTATTRITDTWTAADQADFRQSYATSLAEFLPDTAASEGFELVLARALVLSMADVDPSNPDAFSSNAALVRRSLVDGGLIEMPVDPTAPVDAIVLVGTADSAAGSDEAEAVADRSAVTAIQLKLVTAAETGSQGAVVVSGAPLEGDLVSTIRTDDDLQGTTTTVSDVESMTGQVNVPLSLAARLAGQVGQFGTGTGATAAIPPRVVLDPVVRQAVEEGAVEGEPVDPAGEPLDPAGEAGDPATGEGDAG